jgi:hypothetical protein
MGAIGRDITERKKADQKFKDLLDPDGAGEEPERQGRRGLRQDEVLGR